MKPVSLSSLFSVPLLRLAVCAVVFAGVSQNASARESNSSTSNSTTIATVAGNSGRLVIRRSPVLGYNVSVSVYIDGKPAGTLRRNHSFETSLAPGRHVLVASPSRARGDWQGTLNVRAGETYSYTASYNVDKLVLTPSPMSR